MQTTNLGQILEHKVNQGPQACVKDGRNRIVNYGRLLNMVCLALC